MKIATKEEIEAARKMLHEARDIMRKASKEFDDLCAKAKEIDPHCLDRNDKGDISSASYCDCRGCHKGLGYCDLDYE